MGSPAGKKNKEAAEGPGVRPNKAPILKYDHGNRDIKVVKRTRDTFLLDCEPSIFLAK